MSAPSTTGHPLGDAIEIQENCQSVLVTDTIEADGRFILCHFAAKHPSVLWLACGADSQEKTIRSAIRKLDTSEQDVTVQSIPTLLEEMYEEDHDELETLLSANHILKLIQDWKPAVQEGHQPLLIIDDLSILSTLMGERETYLLAYWARDLSLVRNFCLVMRSLGTDEAAFQQPINYFGAGGDAAVSSEVHWEAGITELADQIVDVRPLTSGYSRDAQGRFIVTDAKQRQQRIYNYLLLDNDIRVFRKN